MASGCKYNIDTNDKQTIMVNVCSLMTQHTDPQTIVWSVCDYLNIPPASSLPVTETNWCLVSCISSCLFAGTAFFNVSSFTYNNVSGTLYCITSCFPVEEPPAPPPGGGGGSSGEPDPAKKEEEEAEQLLGVQKCADEAITWLESEIDRAMVTAGIIAAGFALWIAIFAAEAILEAIAFGLKQTAEGVHAVGLVAEKGLAGLETAEAGAIKAAYSTESAAGHTHTLTVHADADAAHAFTTATSDYVDAIDIAGEIVHTEGSKTTAMANQIFDYAQIALAAAALAAQLAEVATFISAMEARILEVEEQALAGIEEITSLYTDKIDSMNQFIEQGEELIASNEIVVDYDGTAIDDMVNDILVEDL